jgi:hypothetical protein
MLRLVQKLALGAAVLGLSACVATTTFTSTWKAPDAPAVSPVGKTVAALFVTSDEGKRRAAEDILAADLNARGAHGIASYTLVPNAQRGDVDAVKAKLKQAGVQGVVVMRIVGKDQQITYTPGYVAPAYYGGFGPYWGYGWREVYAPGYLTTDTYISIETLIYSLKQDKLLWAGTSRTSNPSNLDKLIQEVADAAAKQMTKQGFLAP